LVVAAHTWHQSKIGTSCGGVFMSAQVIGLFRI
jgi:hypothetical protein